MRLIRWENLDYADLPRVESPSSGLGWARKNLNANGCGDYCLLYVQGLRDVIRDPSDPACREWNERTKSCLLKEIETGAVLVLQNLGRVAFDPFFRRIINPVTGEAIWSVDENIWNPVHRHFGDLALLAARDTIM